MVSGATVLVTAPSVTSAADRPEVAAARAIRARIASRRSGRDDRSGFTERGRVDTEPASCKRKSPGWKQPGPAGKWLARTHEMVEAAGIEPASESRSPESPTGVSGLLGLALLPSDRRDRWSASSIGSRHWPP